ncbi:uncharacterized protein LOC132036222 [Lycium ferocissimum]|uniref:uncharacterized protein LOC132036222 n=1 Tax=Lycium ferocissimum TaxID=112874 RepID=UPI002814F169|nr:uncharacterized protein LOC132036222 [Lycium ferocissimum]
MGICNSCESTSVATVKLILQDGRLQEFPYPIKASYLLQKDPTIFICNSDEMEFGDMVYAINGDEELQLGQLYFALPLKRLRSKLRAEEMAALAVKASSALKRSSSCCREKCGCRNKEFVFSEGKGGGKVADGSLRKGRISGGGSGRRGKHMARLSAIPE